MGLLDLLLPYSKTTGFGPQKETNPFTNWFDQNRGKITGGFAGMAGAGNDPRAALTGWTKGLQHGVDVDTENALIAHEQQQKKDAADAETQKQNQTIAWLQKNAPQYAGMVQNGVLQPSDVGKLLTQPTASQGADPSDVATYKFYANDELKAGRAPKSFDEWFRGSKQAMKSGLGAPIWGKNRKTGEYVPFEPMSDGSISSLVDPKANASDFIFDPGTVASDKAAGAAYGGAQGAQQYTMPKTAQDVETELGNIDALLADKTGMDQSFGNVGGLNINGVGFPNQWTPVLPNTPRAGFDAKLKQVAGENFLTAYATLRGAGAITENEGQAAKEAMARLNTAQSKEDFTKALGDLKAILVKGYATMSKQTSGGPYQSTGFTPPPMAGQNFVYNPATGSLDPQ